MEYHVELKVGVGVSIDFAVLVIFLSQHGKSSRESGESRTIPARDLEDSGTLKVLSSKGKRGNMYMGVYPMASDKRGTRKRVRKKCYQGMN